MPPNYRQQQGQPVSRPERRGAALLAATVVACGLGVGAWSLSNGFGSQPRQDCVTVVVGSATGGGELRQCGKQARAWCLTESEAAAPTGPAVAKACRRQHFPTGP